MSNESTFVRWLASEGASRDFVAWARSTELDWPEVYDACPRADFLLAVAIRTGTDRDALAKASVALAHRALDELVDDRIEAALAELDTARERGIDTTELATRLEREADAAPDLVLSHGFRILAIAANATKDPESLAAIPGLAVELALASVMDCAMTSVVGSLQDELARIVRAHLPAASVTIRW